MSINVSYDPNTDPAARQLQDFKRTQTNTRVCPTKPFNQSIALRSHSD